MSEIERLRAENDELREKLWRFERDVLGDGLLFPHEWRMTPLEGRLLAFLLSRPQGTHEALMTALYRLADNEPDVQILGVLVCRLRRKLAPYGIVIRTIWGQGWAVDEPQRSELRARFTVRLAA